MFPPISQGLRLAFVGLGNIGLPVARNLLSYPSADDLRVWNRTKAKYTLIPEAVGCESIKDLFTGFDKGISVVFTSLVDDEVALEVYGELIKCAKEVEGGCKVIFVEQSTLHPDTTAKLEKDATSDSDGKVYFLASPVLGQPAAAASRQMVNTVAGDMDAIAYVKPILESIGRATIVVGEDVSQASKMKLFVNMMLYESIQVFSEVYALADATGFPSDKLHEVFQTVLPAPPLVNYSNKISKGMFDGSKGFTIDGGLKGRVPLLSSSQTDIRHILSMRDSLPHPLPLPTLETAQANLQRVKDLPEGAGAEMGAESMSAVVRLDGGMAPFKEGADFGSST